ncbi:hypothetical protein QN358_08620 [Subtercola sp. RTI3]|nr:hypothetical protein [Subtercola sp. RTI3]
MKIFTRTRILGLGLAGLALTGTTLVSAPVANAAPAPSISVATFTVPDAGEWPRTVALNVNVSNIGSLQAADFGVLLECSDGATIATTSSLSPTQHAFWVGSSIPNSEKGNTCTLSVVVDRPGRFMNIVNKGPATFETSPNANIPNVHLVGSMPTYSSTGGL